MGIDLGASGFLQLKPQQGLIFFLFIFFFPFEFWHLTCIAEASQELRLLAWLYKLCINQTFGGCGAEKCEFKSK